MIKMQSELIKRYYMMEQKQKWNCEKCSFQNFGELEACEICDSPKKENARKSQASHLLKDDPHIQCSKCKHANTLLVEYCVKCAHPLIDDEEIEVKKEEKPKVNLIKCPKCKFQNDEANDYCVSCEQKLKLKIPHSKPIKKPKPKPVFGFGGGYHSNYCDTCGMVKGINGACAYCPDPKKLPPLPKNRTTCTFCFGKFDEGLAQYHDESCKQRIKYFHDETNPTFDRCTDLQIRTMRHMQTKCEKLHYSQKAQLQKRIIGLKYKKEELQNLHHYIVNYAPIIIHMRAANFVHYAKDTHYRNMFEVHKMAMGGGGGRVQWQDRMFDKLHHNAQNYQRVKYGTMNFTNDPKGVRVCSGYGLSYFLLKPHVRDRCTIADMDTASPTATIGTFRNCFHVFMKVKDSELKAAFEGSKAMELASNVISAYKEIQIHGPVQFAKDIERVYICKNELKVPNAQEINALIEQFCKKNKLECQFFDMEVSHPFFYGGHQDAKVQKVEERFIEKNDKLTEEQLEQLKPKAPAYPGGPFGGGFAFGGMMPIKPYKPKPKPKHKI